jgi:hypothetical protein
MKRIFTTPLLLILLLLPTLGFTTCRNNSEQARTAEEVFALNTDRVTSYTNQALQTVGVLVETKVIKPDGGIKLVDKILNVNAVNKTLINAGSQFIVYENGVKVLKFTSEDRLRLEGLARALRESIRNVANDPNLPIEAKARSQLNDIILPLVSIAERLISLTVSARTVQFVNPNSIEVSSYGNSFSNRTIDRLCLQTI